MLRAYNYHGRLVLTGFIFAVLLSACGNQDTLQTVTEFIESPTAAKSCLLLDEGCGSSQPLFSPKLDPDCGVNAAGETVELDGLFAFRLNILQQTYFPVPIDKWKAMAVTDYGYAGIETVYDNDLVTYRVRRRYCMKYLTKVLGIEYIFAGAIFDNLETLQFDSQPYSESLRIGESLFLPQTGFTMGLANGFDIFSDEFPAGAENDFVIDEDKDGHPGVTIKLRSPLDFIAGDYYLITATGHDEELTVCSSYQLQGYLTGGRTKQNILGSTATFGFTGSTDIEFKSGSTALYLKLNDDHNSTDPDSICSYILENTETIFGGPESENSESATE